MCILQEPATLNRPRVILVTGSVSIPIRATRSVDGAVASCDGAVILRILHTVAIGIEGSGIAEHHRARQH